ncbi:ion transporter [Colwellia sp. D2M02]|uniref:Ion transporter n=1 Tax=Colwellia asteriadis TaxID=517723 RepID=A0ABN1LAR3_9GAMM|nr:ion transporter [Colwellia sp. D2M02]MBU2893384.1 ion transporter [Colwellia sp. D2M02]
MSKVTVTDPSQSSQLSYRAKMYQLLEGDIHKNYFAKIINIMLIILIVGNVVAAMFESEPDYHKAYRQQFALFEIISLSIFFIEYLLRVWCNVENPTYQHLSTSKARLKYCVSPIALIDLIAILPFLIAMFFTIDLRSLRLLRVLRLLKLNHYFKGFNIFTTVIIKELKTMTAAMMVMIFLIIIAASLMHAIEGKLQPAVFGSILKSLWWSVVTMTTVGYGDVVPVTVFGKVVAAFIMLIGVGLVALPAGMLAARFGEELRERKTNLNDHIEDALGDGYIDQTEYQALVKLATKLDIDPEELQRSIERIKEEHHNDICPHCGK